jgi:organic radical activating enzyme
MTKIKNIIFDLDGTLWDSREQILKAWNRILKDKCNLSISVDDFNELVKRETLMNKTKNVVFSGGDPLFKENLEFVKEFLIKYGSLYNICIYTGHNIEYVKENNIKGFKYIKCGTFDNSKKRLSGNFGDQFILASSNQNFYDENYNLISEDGILIYDKKDLYYLKTNERKGD